MGDDDAGAREAAFLRTFSPNVTLIHVGLTEHLTQRSALRRLGVGLVETTIDDIVLEDDDTCSVTWAGKASSFDLVYSALGTEPTVDLVAGLSPTLGDDGRLAVDDHGRTSIPGLFAAGDVVRGLNQIAVATAEGAISATAIHNRLREIEGRTV